MSLPERVRIVEVGPRDGLQNVVAVVPVEARVELIERLCAAGLQTIEAGSFVSPRWVPQMAGTEAVLAALPPREGVQLPVLVPNMQGYVAARASGAKEVAVFGAASESFSRRNTNCSVAEALERFRPVCEAARTDGIRVRGYVSCVLGCPYEGEVAPTVVASLAAALIGMGCYEVSLGDTIGVGTPLRARAMLETVAQRVPMHRLAVHFHDTYGQALANVLACLQAGVSVVDSAVAGLGGCPYASGASGNLATEDLLYMLDGLGIATGVDLAAVIDAGRLVTGRLGCEPTSRVARARRSSPP